MNEELKATKIQVEVLEEILRYQDKEIERLKQGFCELKEKCNKGECDCTHEEYDSMCEENIKLMNRIDKAIEYITNEMSHMTSNGRLTRKELINILQGSDNE